MKSQWFTRGFALIAAVAFGLMWATSAQQSLSKGQVIKQFFSYSITQDLSQRPWAWFSTSLPCVDPQTGKSPRAWAEEPPVFHTVAAFFERASLPPSAVALLSFLLLVWGLSEILKSTREKSMLREDALVRTLLAVAGIPIFLRFSVQHIPDLMATALLVVGVAALFSKRRWTALIFLTLAVTAKFLVLFAVGPILLAYYWPKIIGSKKRLDARALGKYVFWMGVLALPFVIWLGLLWHFSVPNPFGFGTLLENRHSGEWKWLLDPHYWGRQLNWSATKGVGLVLFGFLLAAGVRMFRQRGQHLSLSQSERVLWMWALGAIPYWILVRAGNFVHDHYFLPFAPAWAMLGVLEIERLKNINLRWLAVSVSLVLGAASLLGMKAISDSQEERPTFCNYELGTKPILHFK